MDVIETARPAPEPLPTTPPASVRPPAKPGRDHRVDALRGAALLMMFADHIPQNILNRLTIRNLGFADAAEIFVLLAGFASMLAYGGAFRREGWTVGLVRLGRRVMKLYVFQMLMLITTLLMILFWRKHHTVPVDFLEPELAHGFDSLWRCLLYTSPSPRDS